MNDSTNNIEDNIEDNIENAKSSIQAISHAICCLSFYLPDVPHSVRIAVGAVYSLAQGMEEEIADGDLNMAELAKVSGVAYFAAIDLIELIPENYRSYDISVIGEAHKIAQHYIDTCTIKSNLEAVEPVFRYSTKELEETLKIKS